MFPILTLGHRDDYFKELNSRPQKGVYFTRFIGYDDERAFAAFLGTLRTKARQNGIFLDRTIPNPTIEETQQFYQAVGTNYRYDLHTIQQNIRLWMGSLKPFQVTAVSEAVHHLLDQLKKQNVNDNILKNAYIKFMCWMHNIFGAVMKSLGNEPPKVLYIGDISKYEVYMLYILACSGCDVAYVNFQSDDSYLKTDRESRFSKAVLGRIRKPLCRKSRNSGRKRRICGR